MSRRARAVVGFAYGSASVEIAASPSDRLEGIRFLYRAFEAPAETPHWRYDVVRRGGHVSIHLGDQPIHVARDETDALHALDWCVSCHLLGDLPLAPAVLHAAGVMLPGGGVLLVVAPSGGGKSTLAAALLARGAILLSDEFVPIDPRDLRPLAYPRALGFKHGGPRPSPPIRDEYRAGASRWIQPARALPAGGRGDPVVAVVHCEYDPARPTRLAPIGRPLSLARLLGQAPMLSEGRDTGFRTLAALADAAPSFELVHADAGPAADRLLSLAAAASRREAS